MIDKVLFTENDTQFQNSMIRANISYVIQAYNFDVIDKIDAEIDMVRIDKSNRKQVYEKFKEFIDYNNMKINEIESFVYIKSSKILSFGALEPLVLNPNRYCLSMIVDNESRGKGIGFKTVKFLINYLQSKNLEANARCYVKNDVSKKTLLKSGMRISNRLFKAENIKKTISN